MYLIIKSDAHNFCCIGNPLFDSVTLLFDNLELLVHYCQAIHQLWDWLVPTMYNLINRISASYAKYVPVVDFADMSGTDSTVFKSLSLLLQGMA